MPIYAHRSGISPFNFIPEWSDAFVEPTKGHHKRSQQRHLLGFGSGNSSLWFSDWCIFPLFLFYAVPISFFCALSSDRCWLGRPRRPECHCRERTVGSGRIYRRRGQETRQSPSSPKLNSGETRFRVFVCTLCRFHFYSDEKCFLAVRYVWYSWLSVNRSSTRYQTYYYSWKLCLQSSLMPISVMLHMSFAVFLVINRQKARMFILCHVFSTGSGRELELRWDDSGSGQIHRCCHLSSR